LVPGSPPPVSLYGLVGCVLFTVLDAIAWHPFEMAITDDATLGPVGSGKVRKASMFRAI